MCIRDRAYSTGSVCEPGMYCKWATGQPDRADCKDGSPLEKDMVIWSFDRWATRGWNDMFDNSCGGQYIYQVRCYACERSLCTMSDCPPRTSHVSGYYPDCVCQTETMSPTDTSTTTLSSSVSITFADTQSAELSTTISTPVTISSTHGTTCLLYTSPSPRDS
eukprot:TRINITY_DN25993_c0_g1_i2.p1 TRINITY_DN25993_c0_g1~~TRINITY_DN25993_c0_g1_i2.p1  ORF type:complete len:163 (+),score=22.39 TRINITY_DN25993_c0_g1_i2:150-638(+)